MLVSQSSWRRALIGVAVALLGFGLLYLATTPPTSPTPAERSIAIGFDSGVTFAKVSIWAERIDPVTLHNAKDVDAEKSGDAYRLNFVLDQTRGSAPASLHFVGFAPEEIARCSPDWKTSPDAATPTIEAISFDRLNSPSAQQAILNYFTDPERFGDAINPRPWDSSLERSADDARALAQSAPISVVSGATLIEGTEEGSNGETINTSTQRFSCDLTANSVWMRRGISWLPALAQGHALHAPAVSAYLAETSDASSYLSASNLQLVLDSSNYSLATSNYEQTYRPSGQTQFQAKESITRSGAVGVQLRPIAINFELRSWYRATGPVLLFLAGIVVSTGVTLMLSALPTKHFIVKTRPPTSQT